MPQGGMLRAGSFRSALFALAVFGCGSLACDAQNTTIGTSSQWNGVDAIGTFGNSGASDATFGQTFVAPPAGGSLRSFAFYLDDAFPVSDLVHFQAYVMGWDGAKASGPILFQSGAMSTTNNGGADGFERINVIISSGLKLAPGTAYVAFFSATFDGSNGEAQFGAVPGGGAYPNGGFVHLSNGSNFSAVTTNNWDTGFADILDLAFDLVFAPDQQSSEAQAPIILVVDTAAISSALFSSIPTALAQRELALGASRTTLRDFNGRLFHHRAGESVGNAMIETGEEHTVTVGEGDGIEPARGGRGTKIVYETAPPQASRWEVFTSFDYAGLDVDADHNFLGLQSDTYAGTIGVEHAITPHLCFGAGTSYLESHADHGSDVNGVTLAAYVFGGWGGFYADLLYGATLLDHDIDRDTGVGKIAHASPDSVTHAVNFNTGYNFLRAPWTLGPYVGLDYAHAKIDGYTETGGGTAATRVSEQSVDSLISRVGFQVSHRTPTSWGSITPQVRAGWERENLGSDDNLTVRLLQSPYYLVQGGSIRSTGKGFVATVPGQDRQDDWLALGAGVLVRMGPHFSLLLDYEGDLFGSGYTIHFGKLSLGWQF